MRAVLAAVLVLAAGCVESPPPETEDAAPTAAPDQGLMEHLQEVASFPELRFDTDHGTIRMILYEAWTPETATHIGDLAAAGFYDGTIIHRVVDDFVIQGGDPTGTGEGGSGPGGASTNMVPLEIHDGLQFGVGSVGLARWTDDTGDSQWFITETPAPHLDDPQGPAGEVFGAYSLFAQVFEGIEVVRTIAGVETLPNDRPVADVGLQMAQRLDPPTDVDLIGLVPAVHIHAGCEINIPRHIVAGHPVTVTVHGCVSDRVQFQNVHGGAHGVLLAQLATGGREGQITIPNDGVFDVGLGFGPGSDVFTQVTVLPWHDAYAPYAG